MARFHNTADRDIQFELGGRRYAVPRGGNITIPSRLVYVVTAHDLPLAEGAGPEGAPEGRVLSDALSSELEALLEHAPAPWAAAFRRVWASSDARQHAEMRASLQRRVKALLAGVADPMEGQRDEVDDEAEADREPSAAPGRDEEGDDAEVGQVVAAAAARAGRRPRRGG